MDRVGDGYQEILERRAGNYGKGGVEGEKQHFSFPLKGQSLDILDRPFLVKRNSLQMFQYLHMVKFNFQTVYTSVF